MRKIKIQLQYRVPSWNFCDSDVPTDKNRFSKEKCRFCVSTKNGHHCILYDEALLSDVHFTHKTPQCIEASAGYAITIDEAPPQQEQTCKDSTAVAKAIFKEFDRIVADLVAQGYPRHIAETVARQDITTERKKK